MYTFCVFELWTFKNTDPWGFLFISPNCSYFQRISLNFLFWINSAFPRLMQFCFQINVPTGQVLDPKPGTSGGGSLNPKMGTSGMSESSGGRPLINTTIRYSCTSLILKLRMVYRVPKNVYQENDSMPPCKRVCRLLSVRQISITKTCHRKHCRKLFNVFTCIAGYFSSLTQQTKTLARIFLIFAQLFVVGPEDGT